MKSLIFTLILWMALTLPTAQANSRGPFSLGVVLGEPLGLSAQYQLEREQHLHLITGASLGSSLFFSIDWTRHSERWVSTLIQRPSPLISYWGLGTSLGMSTKKDPVVWSFRIPFGLEWSLRSEPFEFFLELVPGVRILSSIAFIVEGGIGARFCF